MYRDKIYLLRDPVFRGILRRIREYERAKEMAKKCCVCGTKMGFFAEGSCLGENTELNVCETCFNYMNRMHVKIDQEDLTDLKISRDYFGKCIQDKTVLPEALDELRRLFENAAIEEKIILIIIKERQYLRLPQDIILKVMPSRIIKM